LSYKGDGSVRENQMSQIKKTREEKEEEERKKCEKVFLF
jgi:hypothetical protein